MNSIPAATLAAAGQELTALSWHLKNAVNTTIHWLILCLSERVSQDLLSYPPIKAHIEEMRARDESVVVDFNLMKKLLKTNCQHNASPIWAHNRTFDLQFSSLRLGNASPPDSLIRGGPIRAG